MHLFALVLLLAQGTQDAQPSKSAEYNVSIHVQSSQLEKLCDSTPGGSLCYPVQRLNVRIDGKQYRLSRSAVTYVFRAGDYKARVVSEKTHGSEEYNRTYEILLSDGKTARFEVTGESE